MKPTRNASAAYLGAFAEIISRISRVMRPTGFSHERLKMYVAGGAALYLYTGARVSEDIVATFSRRIVLPQNLEVAYVDSDGASRLLYFDYQYNDTLGLLHEDAYAASVAIALDGIDADLVEVRLLSPVDLAVSKTGRLADNDRDDIATLASEGLITARALRRRAEEALAGYVGDLQRVRNSIEIACRIVEASSRMIASSVSAKTLRRKTQGNR